VRVAMIVAMVMVMVMVIIMPVIVARVLRMRHPRLFLSFPCP